MLTVYASDGSIKATFPEAVTSVTASSPLASSGGTTPNISVSSSTGSGAIVLATTPTITTPTIADFTNAQHDHLDADDAGTLTADAIASGVFTAAFLADYFRRAALSAESTNISIASAPVTIGGANPAIGDKVLLVGQTTGSQKGPWIYNGSGNALTRPADYESGSTTLAVTGMVIYVGGGTFRGAYFQLTTTGTITIDTTNTSWSINAMLAATLKFRDGLNLNITTLSHNNTADRTATFPDENITVVGTATAQTLTNKSIVATQLTGALQAAQFPALTGDVTTSAGALATTLATVTITKGGTGQTTKAAAYDALSPLTTKGDIPVYSTLGVRLAVGANKKVLTANSALTEGIGWDDAAQTILVANTALGGSAANIDLASISSGYSHLILKVQLRSDRSANSDNVYVRLNADSTASHYYTYNVGPSGTTPTITVLERLGATATAWVISAGATAATATADYMSVWELHILNYKATNQPRHMFFNGYAQFLNTTGNLLLVHGGGLWTNAADAINQITLLPVAGSNFVAKSSYELLAVA